VLCQTTRGKPVEACVFQNESSLIRTNRRNSARECDLENAIAAFPRDLCNMRSNRKMGRQQPSDRFYMSRNSVAVPVNVLVYSTNICKPKDTLLRRAHGSSRCAYVHSELRFSAVSPSSCPRPLLRAGGTATLRLCPAPQHLSHIPSHPRSPHNLPPLKTASSS
jgi:hypothetical protein